MSLADGSWLLVVSLLVITAAAAWWWLQSRSVAAIAILLVALGGAGGLWLAEQIWTSPREALIADVTLMCRQFQASDPAVIDHFDPQAMALRTSVLAMQAMLKVENNLRLTDFQVDFSNQNSRARVHFRANATVTVSGHNAGYQPARFALEYRRQGTGQDAMKWLIVSGERLNPVNGKSMGLLEGSSGL